MLKKIFIGFFLAGLAACAATLPPLTPAQTSWAERQWPGTGEEELTGARSLFVERCSRCHSLVPPESHSMGEWQLWMNRMSARSKITPDQKGSILRFLAAAKTAP